MKKGKKLLIALGMVVAAVAIAAGSIAGTVAYMTSASKVSNVFTVGNVFITLDESPVDADGKIIQGAERTDRNSYHLMPGKSYDKDPRITVQADTESCYLFLVTRNQITDIEVQGNGEKPTMAQQMVKNGWGIYKDTSAGSRVWVYCGVPEEGEEARIDANMKALKPIAVCGTAKTGSETVLEMATIEIFNKFHITTDSQKSANLSIYSGAEVTINAIGIQSDSFGDVGEMSSLDAAWAAVVNQYPYIQDNLGGNQNNG